MEISEQFLCCNCVFSQHWFIFEALVVRFRASVLCKDKPLLVPHAGPMLGPCPPVYQLCAPTHPRLIPSQAPWRPLLWQISQGLQEGCWGPLGTAHQSPTFSGQFANCSRREPESSPEQAAPVTTIVYRSVFFSQLTCLWVGRWGKLETKLVSTERGGAFLYRKEGNTSVGFYFFPPSSSKKYKETLCLKCECRL